MRTKEVQTANAIKERDDAVEELGINFNKNKCIARMRIYYF